MNRVCLLTGGTSGIGRCTATELCRRGYTVYELSRRAAETPGTHHICGDVTDEQSVQRAVETVLAAEGRIDLLVNNAGFGISGAAEFTDIAAAKKQLDVNFFGAVRLCCAVLPVMRRQGSGRIVNIGSVAGVVPIPFQAFYSAAKAALLSYTLALANEVRPFGITAVCVQPGDIRTGFTAAREKQPAGDEVYGGRVARSVAVMEHDEQTGMAPETAGRFIARVAAGRSRRPVRTIGWRYRLACGLVKVLPAGLCNRLVGGIYAR